MKRPWFALYLLALALWVGGVAIFTLLVTPVVFASFGRDLAGDIVGRLFPYYFPWRLGVSALALVVLVLTAGERRRLVARVSVALLVGAVAANAYVSFKVYPDALEAKRQVSSFEREPPGSPARARFTRLHAASAALNLLVLADGVVLLLAAPALGRRRPDDSLRLR